MNGIFHLVFQISFVVILLFLFVFGAYSFFEKERFAIKRVFQAVVIIVLILSVSYFGLIPGFIELCCAIFFFLFLFISIVPFGNKSISYKIPDTKFDERNSMFSRMELEKGTEKYVEYYKENPENKLKDELFRKEPGLLNKNAKLYNPFHFNAARATFATVNLLQPLAEKLPSAKIQEHLNPEKNTRFIVNWMKKLGAHSVGITTLKPYHVYATGGRGERYGKKVKLNHSFALAFTVEMDHGFVGVAPWGPIIMESSQQYLRAGAIAIQVAQFIRNLGFDARAHIDANYQVICPAVARDAGLGEIGRMGLLMTPKAGPRVRIGVITTNMPFAFNQIKHNNSSSIQFCEICKKCAQNCPSRAIPLHSNPKNIEVLEPWKINHELCFTYWCKTGTDCGRCISVCPFAHPNTFIHKLVRWYIRQNSLNRRLAFILDNLFYGKKPKPKKMEKWMLPT